MNYLRTLCVCSALFFSVGVWAQAATKPAAPTLAAEIDGQLSTLEKEFVSAAEAMPDDKFNFTPGGLNIAGSDYKGVKTFAEEVRHVAASNYILWGAVTGDKSPIASTDTNGPASLKSKAEIIKYLKDSFAVGHKAAQLLTVENALGQVPRPSGKGQWTKIYAVTFAIGHAFDHYGQMVEYLRMNGIVPPASRQQ
ncbi:MAG TPA: DinB family protein [Candidatus Angelobacter sp.]|jgi:uncharacterized damage-inducible protein DinB